MKAKYRLPIKGTVLKREPLTGDVNDPISIFPIDELPDKPKTGYAYRCLDYNIDEGWCEIELDAEQVVHDWFTELLPKLKGIQKEKGWKLTDASIS